MRVGASVFAGGVLLAALAACGGSGGSGGSGSGGGGGADLGPVQHPASLVGEVGKDDAFVISLSDPNGTPIRNLAAGRYDLEVRDESSIHNFHLTGGGVGVATQVGEQATRTFHVTFRPGDYTFVCDPHSSSMHGDFHVT